jgi:hypothetical protein
MKQKDFVAKQYTSGGISAYAISDTDYSVLINMRMKLNKPTNLALLKLVMWDLLTLYDEIKEDLK